MSETQSNDVLSTDGSTNNVDLDKDWNLEMNLSGVQAAVGGRKMAVPKGLYKATVTDMYVNTAKNPNRIVVQLQISEGPYTGAQLTTGLNKPNPADSNDKTRFYWRAFAESVGYQPAQLDAGGLNLNRASFVNRTAHIDYEPPQGDSKYDNVAFLPIHDWQTRLAGRTAGGAQAAAGEGNAATAGAATGAVAITPASGSLGGGAPSATMSLDAIKAKLNLPGATPTA